MEKSNLRRMQDMSKYLTVLLEITHEEKPANFTNLTVSSVPSFWVGEFGFKPNIKTALI